MSGGVGDDIVGWDVVFFVRYPLLYEVNSHQHDLFDLQCVLGRHAGCLNDA
jgi:hypothetical protein